MRTLTFRCLGFFAAFAIAASVAAQTPAPPPAATAPADTGAVARARARRDSILRIMMAQQDSMVRAQIAEAEQRARAQQSPRSPTAGPAPFYGYNWVFLGDVLLGALAGILALRLRYRRAARAAKPSSLTVAAMVGAAGAALLFVVLFFATGLLTFMNALPPIVLFGITVLGIIFVGVSAASGTASRR